jgi:chromosome segregation ATPase
MRTLEVDASAEPAATDIANKIANLVGFLRRFASMISGGDNADRLQDAAALIEDLVDALDRERKEFRDVDTRLMQTVRAHAVAQVEIGSATAELSVLQNEMAEQRRKATADHAAIFGESQEQSARADKAERLLRETTDELVQLRTKLSEIGQSFVVLPVATMDALRAQFEFLGREFGKAGDMTSQAMCEIGACTISEAVAGSLKETKSAVSAAQNPASSSRA